MEPRQEEDRRVTLRVLLAAFVAALAIRAASSWFSGAALPQEIRYITLARGVISGAGYAGLDNRFPDIVQPPLYPLILAGALLLPGPDLALARSISILMGALLVFPAAALARRLLGEAAARRTGCLIAVYPLLAHFSGAAITESTFTLLVVAGALALWRGMERNTMGGRWPPFLIAGLLFGLSFLARPEGLTYLAAACIVVLIRAVTRDERLASVSKGLRHAAWLVAGFAALAIPYMVWVHAATARWLLAPKAVLVQVHHSLMQEGQREGWKEPYGSPLFFEHVKFGLNREATAIRSHEEFDRVSVSVTEGFLVSDEGDVSLFEPAMAGRMVLRNMQRFYLETMKYGFAMPTIVLILAGVGLLSRPWAGPIRESALIMLAFFLAGFSFLLTHVESRFLFPAIPFLLPWAAEGWRRSEEWLLESLASGATHHAALREKGVRVAVGTIVLGLILLHLIPVVHLTASLWDEHREMGLWLRLATCDDCKVMAITPAVSYYAGARFDVLPYADLARLVAYARHRGVDYIVADRFEIPRQRPQLSSLLNPERPHPGLELIKSFHERTPEAIFLYRLIRADESAR